MTNSHIAGDASSKRHREHIEQPGSPMSTRPTKKCSTFSSLHVFRTPVKSHTEHSPSRSAKHVLSCWRSRLGCSKYAASQVDAAVPTLKYEKLENSFSHLKLRSPEPIGFTHVDATDSNTHAIFSMPEIVAKILKFLDADMALPQEIVPLRRRPQSLAHAVLKCNGDTTKGFQLWNQTVAQLKTETGQKSRFEQPVSGNLHSCMLVNKLWHELALQIVLEKLHFNDHRKFRKFLESSSHWPRDSSPSATKPSILILHKLSKLSQQDLDDLASRVATEKLKWFELYICPTVALSPDIFHISCNVEKLILPGNRFVSDQFLMSIARSLPKLKELDLRACDEVSDSGVVAIATSCPQLEICNLGRHRNGHRITSVSLVALARHTQIQTVGAAGCEITDAGVWELAMLRGQGITRLSFNNCRLLTNNSLPALLALNYLPHLVVMEVRNIVNITQVRPFIIYKRWKKSMGVPVLIEGCERIELLMIEEKGRLDAENRARILADLTKWVNCEDF
ncbi:LAMI_0H07294g1_1 [Lachancea mirantina]|uniref:LAMI_0H07294g1_1 n=1 Tax=Lachancea mirantina TaxID=1230905 RepID=A0A1G4KFJ3_9SACH|nr:LAMI_0H07294g1_1 [Lachancea mirantina]